MAYNIVPILDQFDVKHRGSRVQNNYTHCPHNIMFLAARQRVGEGGRDDGICGMGFVSRKCSPTTCIVSNLHLGLHVLVCCR